MERVEKVKRVKRVEKGEESGEGEEGWREWENDCVDKNFWHISWNIFRKQLYLQRKTIKFANYFITYLLIKQKT